jgi:hypothetical protein
MKQVWECGLCWLWLRLSQCRDTGANKNILKGASILLKTSSSSSSYSYKYHTGIIILGSLRNVHTTGTSPRLILLFCNQLCEVGATPIAHSFVNSGWYLPHPDMWNRCPPTSVLHRWNIPLTQLCLLNVCSTLNKIRIFNRKWWRNESINS